MARYQYTIVDVCNICTVKSETIVEMVEQTIVEPKQATEHWLFDEEDLIRIKKAVRLNNDLGINYQGIALALELYDQLEQYQSRVKQLENLINHFER